MPKDKLEDQRYDFRQGRNSVVSPDLLNTSELVDLTNARIDSLYGGVTSRTGTRRIHATGLTSPITGVYQWDAPGGKEVIAIPTPGGDFCHKTSALGDFTCTSPTTPFANTLQSFAPFRSIGSGAALKLYIAGNRLYSWDGTTLTIMAPSGLPTDIDIISAHATRMFAHSISFPKNLYWSKVGDATTWAATGLATDAGTAPVNVLNGEAINSLEVLNSSLLIGAEDSISRFTGSSTDNISLATDTSGLSTEIGPAGKNAMKKFETAAAILNERGPHVAIESGLAPIGLKVEPDFLAITPANLPKVAIGYHRGRKELWFAVPGANDGGVNKTVYVYSTRLQAWMGPWTYPFGIVSFARYEDSNGAENLIAGCTDGFVRLMDDAGSYIDDKHADGTGGTGIVMSFEPAPHFFATGPDSVKKVYRLIFDADFAEGSTMAVQHEFDGKMKQELVTSRAYHNYLLQSELMNRPAVWAGSSGGGLTVTEGAILGPTGLINGNQILTNVYITSNLYQSIVGGHLDTSLIFTIYIKPGSAGDNLVSMGVYNNTTSTNMVFVATDFARERLSSVTVLPPYTGSAYLQAVDNGWYKLVMFVSGYNLGDTVSFYPGFAFVAGQYTYATMASVVYGSEERAYLNSGATPAGTGVLEYRTDISNQGRRGRMKFFSPPGVPLTVLGYSLKAYDMTRDSNIDG